MLRWLLSRPVLRKRGRAEGATKVKYNAWHACAESGHEAEVVPRAFWRGEPAPPSQWPRKRVHRCAALLGFTLGAHTSSHPYLTRSGSCRSDAEVAINLEHLRLDDRSNFPREAIRLYYGPQGMESCLSAHGLHAYSHTSLVRVRFLSLTATHITHANVLGFTATCAPPRSHMKPAAY